MPRKTQTQSYFNMNIGGNNDDDENDDDVDDDNDEDCKWKGRG